MALYDVAYGDEHIRFSLRFLVRAARSVSIHVTPDGAVLVDAPEGTTLPEVKKAVRQRAAWVWQQLQASKARKLHVLPREYISGETHFYLGRRHMLKVQPAHGDELGVRLWRGRLEITTAKRDALTVRYMLEGWYRERATEVFARVIADMSPRVGLRRAPPPLRLLSMRTQWGSCSPKGEVLLNTHLVKAPRPCIEYVVVHELCHLKELNHSERFYRQLDRALPDWVVRKAELDNMAEVLLNR
ncbi:M48 family metallopeptidase [Paraburkholderia caledonica]|uniref:M48 family metallopeptidase n=1 Tax=Paraburkholderia caledonica TaxID=134536 RepID=UPI00037C2B2D|nr:SprT family zinc-dependent metalloprotease [Paraburkholderia caledonica]